MQLCADAKLQFALGWVLCPLLYLLAVDCSRRLHIKFEVVAHEGNNYTFEATFEPDVAGSFKSCVRMYPKNENLVYREDFCYVKWLD